MKFALGTVQFGLNYGVANKSGQVALAEIEAILAECRVAGLDMLDTANAYGDSEARLGQAGIADMRVATKLPPLPEDCPDIEDFVRTAVAGALDRLGIERVYGLLLHQATDLVGPNGPALYAVMEKIKAEGQAGKIGVSIYSPDILGSITSAFPIDLVQAPFNVIDQRLATSGWLAKLSDMSVEVHTRSVFLQGLLLMPAAARPSRFALWADVLGCWDAYLVANDLTPLEGALSFVRAQDEIDHIVVGVDSATQLRAILATITKQTPPIPEKISSTDLALIDPSIWSKS